jgi:HK97 family phage major capsid protein
MKKIIFIGTQFFGYTDKIDRTGAEALIPEEAAKEIIQGVPQNSFIMQLATRAPDMSRKQKRIRVLSTLPTAYFVDGDTGLKQTSKQAWGNKYFDAEELAVIVPIPEAVLDDAEYDIWGEVKPRIMEAFGIAFDAAVAFGVNAPDVWPDDLFTAATAANSIVTLGTGVDLYDDLLGEDGTVSMVENDGFLVNGHLSAVSMRAKFRGLRGADGQPLFKNNMQDSTKYDLDGAPCVFPLNGAFDPTKALMISGDFKQIAYCMRQDVTYKILTEAVIQDSTGAIIYNLAQQDMVALRAVMRVAWQVPNPLTAFNKDLVNPYPFSILAPSL